MPGDLPDPPPPEPMALVDRWLADAAADNLKNAWAMALGTVADRGPAVRFVLLKSISVREGYCVFYTNYRSRKAQELAHSPQAAASLYWPSLGRQLRFEGLVEESPETESDDYFASRPRGSQLNAWASEQSQPLPDPGYLTERLASFDGQFADGTVPRPGHWGGYRFWLGTVEFWTEGQDRFHERLQFHRRLVRGGSGFEAAGWQSEWLQP
jgi:pyridoxamine 5'-phosphate oxidase